jgi:hypothetical protein
MAYQPGQQPYSQQPYGQQPYGQPPPKKRGVATWLIVTGVVVALLCCGGVVGPVAYFFSLDKGKYTILQVQLMDICHAPDPALQQSLGHGATGESTGNGDSDCTWKIQGQGTFMSIYTQYVSKSLLKGASDNAHEVFVFATGGDPPKQLSGSSSSWAKATITGAGAEAAAVLEKSAYTKQDHYSVDARYENVLITVSIYPVKASPAGQEQTALNAFLPTLRQVMNETAAKL